jgi:hypothetical protein
MYCLFECMSVCRESNVHCTFQITPQKKSQVLLGPANKEAMTPHRNWRQNCKRTSLSQSLKECTICNLYGCRFRAVCRMRRTSAYILSDRPNAGACLGAERLGLRQTDQNTPAIFSGARTEDGRPGGFLHETEPSSHHCLTHRQIESGDGTSCWFSSQRNTRRLSAMDPVRISSSTACTNPLTPQRSMSTKSESLFLFKHLYSMIP